jgi:hypothetical protein
MDGAMTKLVIGLAVVVIVVLIIVILAARNMRAEDPEDFEQRPGDHSRNGRGRRDWRDDDRQDRPGRHPARDRVPGLRQGGQQRRPAGGHGERRADERRRVHAPDDSTSDYGQPDYGSRPGHGSGHHRTSGRSRDGGQERQRASVPEVGGDDFGAPVSRHPDGPVPLRSRQPRSKRSDDSADWPSTEWDKLSDVDYWAELASDKPLTTTAQAAAPARPRLPSPTQANLARPHLAQPGPAQVRPVQAGLDPDSEPAAGYGSIAGQLPRRDRDFPRRDRDAGLSGHPPFAAAPVANAAPMPVPAPVPTAGPRAAAGTGYPADDELTVDQSGESWRGQRRAQFSSDDDDPLTSPSFPRVPADDSRSFRSSRTGGHPLSSRESATNAPTQQFASYDSRTAQFDALTAAGGSRGERSDLPPYPDYSGTAYAAPDRPAADYPVSDYPVSDYPAADYPAADYSASGYPTRSGSHSHPGPRPVPASGGAQSAAGAVPLPSGNPYGSYVGTTPSGGLPIRSAADLNRPGSGSYPAPQHSQAQPPQAPPPQAPPPQAPRSHRHGSGSYPPASDLGNSSDLGNYRGNWYPQHGGSAPAGADELGPLPGPGGFDPQESGRRPSAGQYYPDYPADQLPGSYPAGRPGQEGYLPTGYPGTPPRRAHAQDPYPPDGYGGGPGYEALGR